MLCGEAQVRQEILDDARVGGRDHQMQGVRSLLAVEGVSEAAVDFESARAWALARVEVPVARLLTALHFDKYSASVRE